MRLAKLRECWRSQGKRGRRRGQRHTAAAALAPTALALVPIAHVMAIVLVPGAAFGAPALASFGTSAKGVIKGPGSNIWNAGVAKTFAFRERARL